MIYQIHDRFFKSTFAKKQVARDFLQSRALPKILGEIDLDTLVLQKNSFVDKKLRASYSDVIYQVKTTKGTGYLYFLLEPQSTVDALLPGRIIRYVGSIIERDMLQQQEKGVELHKIRAPVVYPFVIYSGSRPYNCPKRLIDVFKEPHLLSEILDNNYVIELRSETWRKIEQDKSASLCEILLKESWRKDFCKLLANHPKLQELINNSSYTETAVVYMLEQDPHDVTVMLNNIKDLNENKQKAIMSALSKMRQSSVKLGEEIGEKRGIKLGEERGICKVIEQLLARGMDKPQVARMLGYSLQKLEQILAAK